MEGETMREEQIRYLREEVKELRDKLNDLRDKLDGITELAHLIDVNLLLLETGGWPPLN